MTGYQTGILAEYWAALYLAITGYRILTMRYKTRVGEVDIVARRGRTLIFIEVKRRSDHEAAALAVTPRAATRIRRAAEQYCVDRDRESRTITPDMRFDAVLVDRWGKISHIENAF